MDPLMLRTPRVFARPNSLDVSDIKARTATILDPELPSTDSIAAPSQDDDLLLANGSSKNWPLNANIATTIYPPITSTGHGAANEVHHWRINNSPYHLDITVNPNHQFDELPLTETLSSGLQTLSQKRLTNVADDTWTIIASGPQSTPIILNVAQHHQSSGQVVEPLEWRQLITLFGKPEGIWGYYATTRRFCEIEFVVWDESRAGGRGVCCAHGSVKKGDLHDALCNLSAEAVAKEHPC